MQLPENASSAEHSEVSKEKKSDQTPASVLNNELNLLIDSVVDYAFITFDLQNRITRWNCGAERILGYSEPEILGQRGDTFFTQQDQKNGQVQKELAIATREGRAQDERWYVKKDGSLFWGSAVMTLLRDDSGQPLGYAKVLRDLSERTKEELHALAAALMTEQEEERRHIARELHDDASQGLALVEMQLGEIQSRPEIPSSLQGQLDRLRSQIAAVSESVRTLSRRLHPSTLEHLGLVPTLRSLGSGFEKIQKLTFHLISFPLKRTIPLPVASVFYRVVQECLENVAKHAPGALVTVRVTEDDHNLNLSIQDNGPGFDPAASKGPKALGLITMQERVRLVGGTFALHTKPGGGTQIVIAVPQKEET